MRIALHPVAGAVGWYRLTGPGAILEEQGHEVAVLARNYCSEEDAVRLVRESDVLVMQGPGHFFKDARPEVHERAGALVFELDDDMWSWKDEPARREVVSDEECDLWLRMAESWIQAADLCTTTTPALARILRDRGAREVAVCDNALPREALGASRNLDPSRIVIGWSGTSPHALDLPPVLAATRRLMKWRPRIEVRTIGPLDWRTCEGWRGFRGNYFRTVAVDQHGRVAPVIPFPNYFDALEALKCDFAVIPLRPAPFCLAKSAVTLYAWGIKGVPVICSRTGPYAAAEEAGFPAVYVEHEDEKAWEDAILDLAENPAKCAQLSVRARAWTLERHTFPKGAAPFERAYARAIERHAQDLTAT